MADGLWIATVKPTQEKGRRVGDLHPEQERRGLCPLLAEDEFGQTFKRGRAPSRTRGGFLFGLKAVEVFGATGRKLKAGTTRAGGLKGGGHFHGIAKVQGRAAHHPVFFARWRELNEEG